MATDTSCTSDFDLPARLLLGRCRKQPRIGSIATNPPPTTMIGKLGDDLLVEILVRSFPDPKSAFRCKAVCKRWSSLILSPCFNRRMISHHQNVKLHPKELQSAILSLLPPMPSRVGGSLKVLDCYKDLVLCGFWDVNQDNGEHSRSYLICNPFTKQWVALPLAPRKLDGYLSPVTRWGVFLDARKSLSRNCGQPCEIGGWVQSFPP
ncbi:unnamed protein product [Linum tenue]|uniref:F-box domain-containing protein n=1 Tax=Linum tenue TaxID=586396 RepID=A0AAV0QS06_9ROSI|nr:unnamed protein product [Linum tenue]